MKKGLLFLFVFCIGLSGIFAPWPALAWTSKKETMTPEEYKAWHAATAKRAICKTNCMRHLYAVDGDSGAHDVYWCAKNWERLVPRCYRAADSDDAGGGGPTPPVITPGQCGTANGRTDLSAAPSTDPELCAATHSISTPVSGDGTVATPWSWACFGSDPLSAADDVACNAQKALEPPTGVCNGNLYDIGLYTVTEFLGHLPCGTIPGSPHGRKLLFKSDPNGSLSVDLYDLWFSPTFLKTIPLDGNEYLYWHVDNGMGTVLDQYIRFTCNASTCSVSQRSTGNAIPAWLPSGSVTIKRPGTF